jgi:hypothetical protein
MRVLRPTLALGSLFLIAGCPARRPPVVTPAASHAAVPFTEIAAQAGVRFMHRPGGSGKHYLPETMGAGCAFFDYDGDGWDDVFLMQGARLPGDAPGSVEPNALFRNEGNGHFSRVPGAAGLDAPGYGMGCCAADLDNDGDCDVFLTRFGGYALFRNDGGHFVEITHSAGISGSAWGASAAFGDYDGDGLVDLFVTNYVEYDPRTAPGCRAPDGTPGYCPPEVFPPTTDRLFRNRGHGRFEDVSQRSGIAGLKTRGLGVEWVDFDRDGNPDLFIGCDQSPNVLWRNQGDGTFKNVAVELAVALDGAGAVQNGMGVDFADADHDGDMDGYVTNFSGQPNAFYLNQGKTGFQYWSMESGLGRPSIRLLGFGCNYLDYDNDGWEDLFVANGHVNDKIALAVPGIGYAEPASLYRNQGQGRFEEVQGPAGQSLWRERVSRGSATADFDHDGDVDLLVSNAGQATELFRNELPPGKGWLTVRLEGTRCNRNAIGARVEVLAAGMRQAREVRAGSSYLSQSSLALTFGLGAASRVEEVRVTWPGGRTTVRKGIEVGQILSIKEPA